MDKKRWSSFESARCLVTGASAGLGQAMARRLAHARARVILTGRTLAPLETIIRELLREGSEPASLVAIDADLTEAEGRNKLIHAIDRHFGALDVAINVAEIRPARQSANDPPTELRALFELDVFALIHLTHALDPLLRSGRQPTLLNLGASHGPTDPEYQASRAAITAFTQAIRTEWSSQGIRMLLMNRQIIITSEKNHTERAILDGHACQILDELHRRRHLIVHNPIRDHLFDPLDILQRFTPRFVTQWMHRAIRHPARFDDRLPRPHFAHKIQRTRKKGD